MILWKVYYEPVENMTNADLPEVREYLGSIPALMRVDAEDDAVEQLQAMGCDIPKEDLSIEFGAYLG